MNEANANPSEAAPAHAIYGPSSLNRAINCPASVFLSLPLKSKKPSKSAIEGTTAHEAATIAVQRRLSGELAAPPADPRFDDEMLRHAQGYADYIYNIVEPFLKFPHTWEVEKRVYYDPRDGWGTADFYFVYKDNTDPKNITRHAIVIDYKYGENIQVDSDTWQLVGYAFGVYTLMQKKVDTITCYIHQPRMDHNPQPVTYTKEQLEGGLFPVISSMINLVEFWREIGNIPEEDLQEFQNLGSWCQFCLAKDSVCKLYNEKRSTTIRSAFEKARSHLPPDLKASRLKDKEVGSEIINKGWLSPEDIAYFALHGTEITNFIAGIKTAALALICNGAEIPGMKVIEGMTNRAFIDNRELLVSELKKLGIAKPVELVEKLITLTDAEKIIGKNKIPSDLFKPQETVYKLASEDEDGDRVVFGKDKTLTLFREAVERG